MIRWLGHAEDDLMAIEDYIALDNPIAAIETADKIWFSTSKLTDNPQIGREGRVKGTRELVVTGTPYIVVYQQKSKQDDINILRVLHGSQRWGDV